MGNVRDRVRAGDLGHVHMIKTTSRDSPLPSLAYLKISGGIFHDCAVHVKNETPNKTVFSDDCGSSEVPMYYSFPSRHADGYMRELDHFLDVVQGKCEMSVTDRMTSAVSKIADACEESAKTNKTVQLTWE